MLLTKIYMYCIHLISSHKWNISKGPQTRFLLKRITHLRLKFGILYNFVMYFKLITSFPFWIQTWHFDCENLSDFFVQLRHFSGDRWEASNSLEAMLRSITLSFFWFTAADSRYVVHTYVLRSLLFRCYISSLY